MTWKAILCGVDFSQASLDAFTAAVDVARASHASLHVLHCIEVQAPTPPWFSEHGLDDAVTSLEGKAERAMQTLVETASDAGAVPLTTEITTGKAVVELLVRARTLNVDLIVIGRTGLTLLEESVFGGTAEKVMRDAPCSVLVVRRSHRKTE
jgi:universal stress protein A